MCSSHKILKTFIALYDATFRNFLKLCAIEIFFSPHNVFKKFRDGGVNERLSALELACVFLVLGGEVCFYFHCGSINIQITAASGLMIKVR